MAAPVAIAAIPAVIGLITDVAGTAQANAAYNSAGKAAQSAAQYNSRLIDLNLNRQLELVASDLRTFSSTQRSQIAKSGVALSSKSSLIVMDEALRNFEKEAVIAKENARFQKAQEQFNLQQQQAVFAQQRKASGIQGILSTATGAASLFSSLGV